MNTRNIDVSYCAECPFFIIDYNAENKEGKSIGRNRMYCSVMTNQNNQLGYDDNKIEWEEVNTKMDKDCPLKITDIIVRKMKIQWQLS